MRTFVVATFALLTTGLFSISPAEAKWTCIGPEFVCKGSSESVRRAARPRQAWQHSSKPRHYARQGRSERRVAAQRHRGEERRTVAPRVEERRTAAREIEGTQASRAIRRARSTASRGGGSTGIASYYWEPQRLASGGRFNPNALTAAHRSLPFGTRVRVTHLGNGRSVEVRINDRGPFVRGRIIDLSRAAADIIGMRGAGVAHVRLEVMKRG